MSIAGEMAAHLVALDRSPPRLSAAKALQPVPTGGRGSAWVKPPTKLPSQAQHVPSRGALICLAQNSADRHLHCHNCTRFIQDGAGRRPPGLPLQHRPRGHLHGRPRRVHRRAWRPTGAGAQAAVSGPGQLPRRAHRGHPPGAGDMQRPAATPRGAAGHLTHSQHQDGNDGEGERSAQCEPQCPWCSASTSRRARALPLGSNPCSNRSPAAPCLPCAPPLHLLQPTPHTLPPAAPCPACRWPPTPCWSGRASAPRWW